MLITASGLTDADIDVAETVDPTPVEDRMNRRGGHSKLSADTDRAEPLPPCGCFTFGTIVRRVSFGLECGLYDRPCMPASPISR